MAGVEVRSAGVAATPGAPASEGARRVAGKAGLELASHRSMPLTREMVESSSLVLCMGRGHVAHAEALGGCGRCRLLKEMAFEMDRLGGGPANRGGEEAPAGEAGGSGWFAEVADPFGGGAEVYMEMFLELEWAVEAVLDGLARDRE